MSNYSVSRRNIQQRPGDSGYAQILRTLLFLSIPTIVEEVLATLLQYVDTAMVGQLGEQATASVSITTNVTWLVNSVSGAVGTAILVLISKASGAGDDKQVKKLSQQALFLALVSGVLLEILSLILCPYIPVWMGAEPAIRDQASRYFFIISAPLVFRYVSTVLGAALRAVQDTKTPMLISLAANGLNIVLNYFLIYPADLGVDGAAIASAVSYALSGILMFVSCRKNSQLCWKAREFSVDRKLLAECADVGMPVLGTSMVSCFGYVVCAYPVYVSLCAVLGAGTSRCMVLHDRGQCVQGSPFHSSVSDKTQPGETMAWPFLNLWYKIRVIIDGGSVLYQG